MIINVTSSKLCCKQLSVTYSARLLFLYAATGSLGRGRLPLRGKTMTSHALSYHLMLGLVYLLGAYEVIACST